MICRVIPYEGSEPYIFLSYCRKDSAAVYPLFEQMAQDGYRVWYDNGNNAGDDWPENIAEHLDRSHICLAFVSEQSSISHNCKTEITFAIECNKKLVPVFLEDFPMPLGMRMQLSSLHYLKKTDFPSDSALLNKIYGADGIKDCKGAPGALRPISQEPNKQVPPVKTHSGLVRDLSAPSSPDQEDPPALAEDPAPVGEKPVKKPRKVKLVSQKKKPKPQTPPAPEPADPVPPKKDILPETDPGDLPDPPEVPATEDGGDPTECPCGFDDNTVRERPYEIDGDKTVRGNSANTALLLQPSRQKYFLLKGPQTKIGRHPAKCDVVIEGNDSVSKHHANIIQTKRKFYLSDEGSANGTFLNGEPLESKKQVPLDNPAIFQLYDETLILISGPLAKQLIQKGSVSLLINKAGTALRILEGDTLPLNRGNVWSDGKTLKDTTVHRAAHALLRRKEDGVYLVDESPQNGTYLNGDRLPHGEARMLTSGDHIRIGDNTVLEFITITLKENKQ